MQYSAAQCSAEQCCVVQCRAQQWVTSKRYTKAAALNSYQGFKVGVQQEQQKYSEKKICTCHGQSVSVTDGLCLSQIVCVRHRHSLAFTEMCLCLSQTVCVCQRQCVSVSNTIVTNSWPGSYLFINDFHHDFSVRFEFVQNLDSLEIHFLDHRSGDGDTREGETGVGGTGKGAKGVGGAGEGAAGVECTVGVGEVGLEGAGVG